MSLDQINLIPLNHTRVEVQYTGKQSPAFGDDLVSLDVKPNHPLFWTGRKVWM